MLLLPLLLAEEGGWLSLEFESRLRVEGSRAS